MNLPILFIHLAILCPGPESDSEDSSRIKYDPVTGTVTIGGWTAEEATAQGRKRAQAEYAAGKAEIEVFGLWEGWSNVEEETGLYIRKRGCVSTGSQGVESDAYNERLRELIAKDGLSKSMQDVKNRFEKSQTFETHPPKLDWKQIPAESKDQPATTIVGDYSLQFVREINADIAKFNLTLPPGLDPVPAERTYINITKGESHVGELPVYGIGKAILSDTMEAAYWPDFSLIVFKHKGKTNTYKYFDVINGRLMWETNHRQRFLQQMNDLRDKSATIPS